MDRIERIGPREPQWQLKLDPDRDRLAERRRQDKERQRRRRHEEPLQEQQPPDDDPPHHVDVRA
jgi:hypothetical protein